MVTLRPKSLFGFSNSSAMFDTFSYPRYDQTISALATPMDATPDGSKGEKFAALIPGLEATTATVSIATIAATTATCTLPLNLIPQKLMAYAKTTIPAATANTWGPDIGNA